MNKIIHETDLVTKAHEATHKIRQPSWAAHCAALSINLDEAEAEAEAARRRPTIKVRTPAYDFRPTPLVVIAPGVQPIPPSPLKVKPVSDDTELDWGT